MRAHFRLLRLRAHGLCFKFWFYWKARPLRAASSLLQTATSLGLTAVNSDACSSIRNLNLWAQRML